MGRFSPTVRPEPFNLGGILDHILNNYEGGRQVKRGRKREEREETLFRQDQEDRSTALRDRRAEQLSRPGARTLSDFLADADQYRDGPDASEGPLTDESLRRIGNAGDESATIDFKRPDPTPVLTRGGPSVNIGGVQMPIPQMMEEQAPFVTGHGVVMDPRRARQQTTLASELDRQAQLGSLRDELELRKEMNPEPWKPITPEEQLDWEGQRNQQRLDQDLAHDQARLPYEESLSRARARGNGTLDQRDRPLVPWGTAYEALRSMYAKWVVPEGQPELGHYEWPQWLDDPRMQQMMIDRVQKGEPLPGKQGLPFANPDQAGGADGEMPNFFNPSPSGGGDLTARAQAIRQAHPEWSREQVRAELRKSVGPR